MALDGEIVEQETTLEGYKIQLKDVIKISKFSSIIKSKKYAKIRNKSNKNPNPALKPKREMPDITNSRNTKRTYGRSTKCAAISQRLTNKRP